MKEPDDSDIPSFLLHLKPRAAPEKLRELVICSVAKELEFAQEQSRWFTKAERRRFQFVGLLLIVSVTFCFAVEKNEQSRNSRLDSKDAMPNQLRELYAFIAGRDDPHLFAWFSRYCEIAKSQPETHLFDKKVLQRIVELDPELKKYVRQYHGVF